MTREEQFEILKMTYVFEETVEKLLQEAEELKFDEPKAPEIPEKPVKPQIIRVQVQKTPYPEIIPPEIKQDSNQNVKGSSVKNGAGLLFGGVLYAGLMLKKSIDESKQQKEERKRMIEEIRNSPEYRQKCLQIDEENRLRQEEQDKKAHEEYLRECERYNILLQRYHEELEQYNKELKEYHEQAIPEWVEETDLLQKTIKNAKITLQELYGKNVLPLPYQNKTALSYIVSYMGSSQSDLEYIIERYDTSVTHNKQEKQIKIANEQARLLRGILSEQQYANYLNERKLDLTVEGNSVLKNINNFQKFDFTLREYRRIKAKRAAKKARG